MFRMVLTQHLLEEDYWAEILRDTFQYFLEGPVEFLLISKDWDLLENIIPLSFKNYQYIPLKFHTKLY